MDPTLDSFFWAVLVGVLGVGCIGLWELQRRWDRIDRERRERLDRIAEATLRRIERAIDKAQAGTPLNPGPPPEPTEADMSKRRSHP